MNAPDHANGAIAAVDRSKSFLLGLRVLEVGDELGEYCGKLLAGLGADVVKIEPPGGERTRNYGPFYQDTPHPDRSLYFWHYNLGKRSVVLDLDTVDGQAAFRRLAAEADVVLDARPRGYLDARGIGYDDLARDNPGLIMSRIVPFGDDGPWADFLGSDLVHLALGGVMMNCGYDPDPRDRYDTPPIAPQMWQAYHIAGEMAAIAILSALNYREASGRGQRLTTSVHEAVSKNTETDLPNWVYLRQAHRRQTCRHSRPASDTPAIAATKDGRWVLPYRTYLPGFLNTLQGTIRLLKRYGMELDLESDRYQAPGALDDPIAKLHVAHATERLVGRTKYADDLWKEAQAEGLPWAPLRRPEEHLTDDHWASRETFVDVEHPELGKTFTYVGARWYAPEVPWVKGPRAPLVGEHTPGTVDGSLWSERPPLPTAGTTPEVPLLSRHGRPFALAGVKVVDLSWLLASGGAGRFLTALGADVIKVEHSSRPDGMRYGVGGSPIGGRAEREAATGPIPTPPATTPNRSGTFNEINAGKRSLSLNLKTERGKEILARMIREADILIEGFTPGTLERLGFGYERLRELNPSIIYVQQSGMGQHGTYGTLRSYGPTAQAFSGLSEMSGLPEPYPPAGIGYSYLDWYGAYNMAVAMLAALYRRRVTGRGCHIDSSQVETGIYLTGTAVLDHVVNGRRWSRYGNRSPYKPAAPHGAFRTRGEDRWIAIACFTDAQWSALTDVLGASDLATDPRFATLEARMEHQDELEALVERFTVDHDGYELMERLQRAGVPAGVCQTAQDRYETDPQLAHLGWLVELNHSEIGRWPVKELPTRYSVTPPYIGGFVDRHGPCYGEDTRDVLKELGFDDADIDELAAEGVIELPATPRDGRGDASAAPQTVKEQK